MIGQKRSTNHGLQKFLIENLNEILYFEPQKLSRPVKKKQIGKIPKTSHRPGKYGLGLMPSVPHPGCPSSTLSEVQVQVYMPRFSIKIFELRTKILSPNSLQIVWNLWVVEN